jgi:hypothetical protein
MFARRREKEIPKLRSGISIKTVMIAAFFTARQLIARNSLPTRQKYSQEYFVQSILPSLPNERKPVSRQKTAINFPIRMDSSMCHSEDQFVDELRRLKIRRTPIHLNH